MELTGMPSSLPYRSSERTHLCSCARESWFRSEERRAVHPLHARVELVCPLVDLDEVRAELRLHDADLADRRLRVEDVLVELGDHLARAELAQRARRVLGTAGALGELLGGLLERELARLDL